MKIKVKISTLLLQLGELDSQYERVELTLAESANSTECLQSLVSRFPSLRKWVFEKGDSLRPVIFLFINGEKLVSDELSKPLKDGDELFVVLSFAGG